MKYNLIKENGEILRIAEKVKLVNPHFEHYEIIKDKKQPLKNHIIGYDGEKKAFANKTKSPLYTDDRMVLDSLLSLNFKILNNLSVSRERQEKTILKWCKKYGLPFQKCVAGSNIIQTIVDCPYREQGFFSFDCEAFCIELSKLYNAFMLMIAYKEEVYIGLDDDRNIIHKRQIQTIRKSMTKEDVETFLLNYFKEIKFIMDIDFDGKKYLLIPTFLDMFELAKYQLLLLYNADSTTGVKTCKCCGALFSCTHRSQEFCGECSPQKYYAKKKREEKKMKKDGENNG